MLSLFDHFLVGLCCKNSLIIQDVAVKICSLLLWNVAKFFFATEPIFDQSYAEIAAMLEMDEAACRKLVSRARQNISRDKVRHITPRETQDSLLCAFQSAVMSGNITQLSALLSSDIRLKTDTGGKTVAATRVLEGVDVFSALSQAHVWWEDCQWDIKDMNGGRGQKKS